MIEKRPGMAHNNKPITLNNIIKEILQFLMLGQNVELALNANATHVAQ